MVALTGDELSAVDAEITRRQQYNPTPAYNPQNSEVEGDNGGYSSSYVPAAPAPSQSYYTGDANGDGLQDSTGWANGVVSNGQGGYSYNGQATTSSGAALPPPVAPPMSNGGFDGLYSTPAPSAADALSAQQPGTNGWAGIMDQPAEQQPYNYPMNGGFNGVYEQPSTPYDPYSTVGIDAYNAQSRANVGGNSLSYADNPVQNLFTKSILGNGAGKMPDWMDSIGNIPYVGGLAEGAIQGATTPAGLASLWGGAAAAPLFEGIAPALGGGLIGNIGRGAVEGGAFNAGLTGLQQAGTGQFDPKGLGESALFGAALGGALPVVARGAQAGVGAAIEHAPGIARGAADAFGGEGALAGERGSIKFPGNDEIPRLRPSNPAGMPGPTEGELAGRAAYARESPLPTAMQQYGEDFNFENPKLVKKFAQVQPDDPVTIYRAISNDDPNGAIRPGDWVALDRNYAAAHGELGSDAAHIVSQVVPAKDIGFGGTSVDEWVYAPADAPIEAGAVRAEGASAAPPPAEPPVRSMGTGGEPPSGVTPGADIAQNDARRSLLDAVTQEANIRRTGTAAREISEGRGRQAGGIVGKLNEGMANGLSGEELAAQARSGAATGPLRKTVTAALDITPEAKSSLVDELSGKLSRGEISPFDFLRGSKALGKIFNGEGLQPAEIRTIRQQFGDEVANAIAERPKPLVSDARLAEQNTAKEQAINARAAKVAEADTVRANRATASLQEQIDRRANTIKWKDAVAGKSIEDLGKMRNQLDDPFMTAEEKKTAERFLNAAMESANKADAAEIASGRQLAAKVAERDANAAQRDVVAGNRRDFSTAMRNDAEKARGEARTQREFDAADQAEINSGRRYQEQVANRYAREDQANTVRTNRAAERDQIRADKADPSDEMLRDKAKKISGEVFGKQSALNRTSIAIQDNWIAGNRQILDGLGETAHETAAGIKARLSGDVADSYLTALLHRVGYLKHALEMSGEDPAVVKGITKTLQEMELKKRYPGGVPERIQTELAKTKAPAYGSEGGTILRGMEAGSQAVKNMQFGLADFGVMGQQVLHVLTTGSVNILAGTINRVLDMAHLPSLDTEIAGSTLPKRIQYQLDGLPQGLHTGMTEAKSGTLLQWVPLLKRIDPAVSSWIEHLSNLQFGAVLGNIRNIAYEGNLVLAHVTGQDIMNPAVRATAAEHAAALTSAAPAALRRERALAESALALSPSMRRAQVAQIIHVAKVFGPGSTATERVLGATTILSAAGATLAVGKLLNDHVGTRDFEFDPSKYGFGQVTLPGGTVVDFFPQQQVVKALARSVRELAEADPKMAAEAWGNMLMTSSSPPLGALGKAVGFGYDPSSGYRYGDFGKGMSAVQRLINISPIPPIFQSLYQHDLTPANTPLNILGVNAYTEGATPQLDDVAKSFPGADPSKGFYGQSPSIQKAIYAQNPELEKLAIQGGSPERKSAATFTQDLTAKQAASDTRLTDGSISPNQWIDDYHARVSQLQGSKAAIYANAGTFAGHDPVLDNYYKALDGASMPDGTVDWDAIDSYRSKLTDAENKYIDKNTGLTIQSPKVADYRETSQAASNSGYYDLKEKAWDQLKQEHPAEMGDLGTYDEFKTSEIADITKQLKAAGKIPPEAIGAEAVRTFDAYNSVQSVNTIAREDYRHQWVADNPKLALKMIYWDKFTPDKAERKFLGLDP